MTDKRQWIFAIVTLIGAMGKCVFGAENVEIRRGVTYYESGSLNLLADLYLPTGSNEKKHPGVVMVHGGAWRYGQRWQVYRHARILAEGGYVVMAITYRLAPQHKFPSQIEDCRNAVRWLRDNAEEYQIDPQRIAGYGYSAGAHLVCLLGSQPLPSGDTSDATPHDIRIQAVVAGGAPCDFDWVPPNGHILEYLFGGSPLEKPKLYCEAAPINFVSADDPPFFFWHGEQDEIVDIAGPRRMCEKLAKAGVKTEFVVVPGAGHIGAFLDEQIPYRARDFLDSVLKNGP